MIMVSESPDELSENDEFLKRDELRESDCTMVCKLNVDENFAVVLIYMLVFKSSFVVFVDK